MSTPKFPNADEQKVLELGALVDDLLLPSSDHQKTDALVFFITHAHMCAAMEAILHSSEIKALCTYDPTVVQAIVDKLKECR